MSGDGAWLPRLLASVEAAEPVSSVRVFAAELSRQLGAEQVSFLLTDVSGRLLVRLTRTEDQGPGEDAEQLPLTDDHLPYRTAVVTQQVQVRPEGGGSRVLVPVSARGDAMGLLELLLSAPPDAQVLELLEAAGRALALVVTAERRHTDLYEWGARSHPVSLAAEIQHRLLPGAFTCEAGAFTLAGWLEPAGRVGGDTFDYSLEQDRLYLSMTDAMGHGLDAALLATVAVGSLRNSRRAGLDLLTIATHASESVEHHRRGTAFVTGVLLSVDLRDGSAQVVNAGHPLPLLQRGGTVRPVELEADLPFGLYPGTGYRVQHVELRPGDRLVLLTDGMVERNAARLDLTGLIEASREQHPRELIQILTAAVGEAVGGRLTDDAAALCVDWH